MWSSWDEVWSVGLWFSAGKQRDEVSVQGKEFHYLEVHDGPSEVGLCSVSTNAGGITPDHRDDEGAEPEDNKDTWSSFWPSPAVMPWALARDWKNKADKCLTLVSSAGWQSSALEMGLRSSDINEELRVRPLLLHVTVCQLMWIGHLLRKTPRCPPLKVFWAHPTGRKPRGERLTTPERLYIPSALWTPKGPWGGAGNHCYVWTPQLDLLPLWTNLQQKNDLFVFLWRNLLRIFFQRGVGLLHKTYQYRIRQSCYCSLCALKLIIKVLWNQILLGLGNKTVSGYICSL